MTGDVEARIAARYRLDRSLGSGGMGRVWLAWDERLRRNVAVKEVLPPRDLPEGKVAESVAESIVGRTLREARAAAKLRHPGIITVHDVFHHDGRPWIVMEFIDGPSLAGRLRDEGPLPVNRAAEIAIQVIEALDAAHEQGVLHRDVKPSNIMLGAGQVVLTDFGIAAIDGATVLTSPGQVIGSPEYMAPECFDERATRASDLWSVGITLYNMVIGNTPFRRARTSETVGAIIRDQELDPHPGLGPLWPVVRGLLRKKAVKRITAPAAIELLREVLGRPEAQPLVPPIPPANRPVTLPGVTFTENTARRTRKDAPAIPPPADSTERLARPGDETLDPVPVRPRKRVPAPVYVGAAAVLVVVVLTAVFSAGDRPIGGVAAPVSSVLPPFAAYSEPLGFSVDVPRDYLRLASTVSTVSNVVWQAQQTDPAVGGLLVQVTRDESQPVSAPLDYLTAKEHAQRTDTDYTGYQRLSLTTQGAGQAVWEYTIGSVTGGDQFHVRALAVAGAGGLYLLTFSLYAQDTPTLAVQWRSVQPIMDKIRASFHLTS